MTDKCVACGMCCTLRKPRGCIFLNKTSLKCMIYPIRPIRCRTFRYDSEVCKLIKKYEPDTEIDLFGEDGLKRALKKLNVKEIKCSICKKNIEKPQIAAFFPMEKGGIKGKVGVCCERPACFMAAVYESKRFEK